MPSAHQVTLLYLVKQLELAVRSRLDEAVAPASLTSVQYTALTVLQRHPGMTSAELARNSFVRAQTMAQMTTSLEREGFIRRERDTQNRRQILLFLTLKGESVVDSLFAAVNQIEADMIEGFDVKRVGDFRTALRASRESLGGSEAH